MRVPKILFVLHYPPPTHGAAVVGCNIKSSGLINLSFNARYINLGTSRDVNEIGGRIFKKSLRVLVILAQTSWQGLTWRPDVVYITLSSHGAGLLKDSLVVAICRLLRLPHVFHFHNKGVKFYSELRIGKLLYPFVFKKAKVILLSPLLYEDIAAYVSEANVFYCANGIPEGRHSNNNQLRSTEKGFKFLFLSNLIESKGIIDLLQACKLLMKKGFEFHCAIAGGEGDLTGNDIANFIETKKLQQHISYVGKVSGDEKSTVLREADIFIHPTKEDCFPLVLLEAMQFGLPIITTYEGAIPEMVKDKENGFIVSKNSPEDIAERVEIYMKNRDLLRQHGYAGRKRYEQHYTLPLFEERLKNILVETMIDNQC